MLKVIGKNNCSRCDMVKNILNNKGIEFEYELMEELGCDEKKEYMKMARENGIMEFPLIYIDSELKSLDELVEKLKGDM